MPNGAVVVGVDCVGYYDAAGAANDTFLAIGIENGEVSIPLTHDEAELIERGNDWVTVLLGKSRVEVSFTLTRRPGNTAFDAFRTAFITKVDIGVMFLSGPENVAGHQGVKFDAVVTSFEVSEPESAEASTVSVTLKPSGKSSFTPTHVLTSES